MAREETLGLAKNGEEGDTMLTRLIGEIGIEVFVATA